MFHLIGVLLTVLVAASHSVASVIEFTDKNEWEAAVGAFTTIDFVLPPSGTVVTNQYADQGVHFTGITFSHESFSAYPNDEWGLRGVGGAWVHFDTPQQWVAVDYPGAVQLVLYLDGALVYTSTYFTPSELGSFAGLLSPVQFDMVRLHRPGDTSVFIDDLHFGTSIPAPSVIGLLALGGFVTRRRRA